MKVNSFVIINTFPCGLLAVQKKRFVESDQILLVNINRYSFLLVLGSRNGAEVRALASRANICFKNIKFPRGNHHRQFLDRNTLLTPEQERKAYWSVMGI